MQTGPKGCFFELQSIHPKLSIAVLALSRCPAKSTKDVGSNPTAPSNFMGA